MYGRKIFIRAHFAQAESLEPDPDGDLAIPLEAFRDLLSFRRFNRKAR